MRCKIIFILCLFSASTALAASVALKDRIFDPGSLKPIDSRLKVRKGQEAPDFSLTAIDGSQVRLSDYRNRKNVMLSFIPAAWTPVCSDQWPGYNLARPLFDQANAVLLGISVDNRATQFAWVEQMGGLWFPVLSDFWPHGEVADRYGVLRTDGTAERALVFIDTRGVITRIYVSDINRRPPLELIAESLAELSTAK
jgi:peroxiredoxin